MKLVVDTGPTDASGRATRVRRRARRHRIARGRTGRTGSRWGQRSADTGRRCNSLLIYVGSVVGPLLVHPVTVAFHLTEERDDVRIRALPGVTGAASMLRWAFFYLTIASGLLLGIMGTWLGTVWFWAALVIFIAIGVVMHVYSGRTIDRIADTRDDAEMERLLSRFQPIILAISGAGGLLVVLYLLIFKP